MFSSRPEILLAAVLLGAGFVAGYLIAEGWWGVRDTTAPLAQICARVDYVNSLQEELPEMLAPEQQSWRAERAARGIPTVRGGTWTPVQVSAILKRACR
jgi:hypothetical protein